jgi:hypothetical protein
MLPENAPLNSNRIPDGTYKWVADGVVKKALLLGENVSAPLVSKCTKDGYAPDLTDSELLQIGRDPFLIAYAMVSPKDRCIVSNEVSAPSKNTAQTQDSGCVHDHGRPVLQYLSNDADAGF